MPFAPQRITVNGTTGSGKSTLARRVGEQLNLPYTELDSLFHGPGWTPRESFVEDVERFASEPAWVTEFQYDQARELLVERADLMVWLDISRGLVMWRVASVVPCHDAGDVPSSGTAIGRHRSARFSATRSTSSAGRGAHIRLPRSGPGTR